MPRHYNTYGPNSKHGQEVVQPFKFNDWQKMEQICLMEKEAAPAGSLAYYRAYRSYILLLIGVNVGARISDLIEFTPRNFAGGRCEFRAHKTGKLVRYEIDHEIDSEIQKYVAEFHISINTFLFRSTAGKDIISDRISRQMAWREIHRLAKLAGVEYCVGTHSLRKSYARWLYDAGMNLSDVAALLQHEDPMTTLRYICIDSESTKDKREHIRFVPKFRPS